MSLEQIIGIALIIAIICMVVWLIDKLAVPIIISMILIGIFALLKWILPKLWIWFKVFNDFMFQLPFKLAGIEIATPSYIHIIMAICLVIGLLFLIKPMYSNRMSVGL